MDQWWIDTIGKLGPFFVSLAVLAASLGQNRWNNRVAIRAAQMEDQKLRLALLERRAAAVDAMREVAGEYHSGGAATRAIINRTIDVLQAAELVFEDEVEQAVSALLVRLFDWQRHHRRLEWLSDDPAERRAAEELIIAQEEAIVAALPALSDALLKGSRVTLVAPLHRPRLFGFLN